MDLFDKYFEQMLDLLPQGAVIVMDNASYQLPTVSWKKNEIIEWLKLENIPYDTSMVKKELMSIANEYKSNFKKYVIDEMATNRGIQVLRLPP